MNNDNNCQLQHGKLKFWSDGTGWRMKRSPNWLYFVLREARGLEQFWQTYQLSLFGWVRDGLQFLSFCFDNLIVCLRRKSKLCCSETVSDWPTRHTTTEPMNKWEVNSHRRFFTRSGWEVRVYFYQFSIGYCYNGGKANGFGEFHFSFLSSLNKVCFTMSWQAK